MLQLLLLQKEWLKGSPLLKRVVCRCCRCRKLLWIEYSVAARAQLAREWWNQWWRYCDKDLLLVLNIVFQYDSTRDRYGTR